MPCVGKDAFATLPSYSASLVCHLPFKEVEAYVTLSQGTVVRHPERRTKSAVEPEGRHGVSESHWLDYLYLLTSHPTAATVAYSRAIASASLRLCPLITLGGFAAPKTVV